MMWFGWETISIDDDGMPTEQKTDWEASCFVLFTYIIYVGKIEQAR